MANLFNKYDWKTRYCDTDIALTTLLYKEMTKNGVNATYGFIPKKPYPKPKKVYYDDNAGVTVVLWDDGDKTVVRAAEGDKHDAYLGYCVALAKKIHGTNSALKRDLGEVLVMTTKKEKK